MRKQSHMTDDIDVRRRRAAYRALHRGTKELDALVGRYVVARLPQLIEPELDRLEQFLALPDPTLHAWILAKECAAKDFADLVGDIRAFHGFDALAH